MLAKQYTHRLPADYDMARIRDRVARRGVLWDSAERLAFKAFVARERGRYGATTNVYASVYLWLEAEGAADFIVSDRFQSVIDTFGRPGIEMWLPLDARRGRAANARALYREDMALPEASDISALKIAEEERNAIATANDGTLAVMSALDPLAWRLVRITLSSELPDQSRPGTAYQIFHLAHPGLARLR